MSSQTNPLTVVRTPALACESRPPAPTRCAEASHSAAARRSWHWTALLVSCGIMALAMLLRVESGERVGCRWLPGGTLPHLCLSRSWLGINCPGCGLTRSIVHLAHGDWQASLATHRLGWMLWLAILFQFPYRIFALLRTNDVSLDPRITRRLTWALALLLTANWLFDITLSKM